MLFSTGSNEIQQFRWKSSLGRIFGAVSLKPWSSKCRSMRSSQGAIQPSPDSRKPMRSLGCRSHTSPQITLIAANIILHRVRDHVARRAVLEAVDADRGHPGIGAFVKADREVEFLGRRPERLVGGIVERAVPVRVGL